MPALPLLSILLGLVLSSCGTGTDESVPAVQRLGPVSSSLPFLSPEDSPPEGSWSYLDLDGDTRVAWSGPTDAPLRLSAVSGPGSELRTAWAVLGAVRDPIELRVVAEDAGNRRELWSRRLAEGSEGRGWIPIRVPWSSRAPRPSTLRFESSGESRVAWAGPRVVTLADGTTRLPSPLVLVSVDTLRPDFLSVYGYSRPSSPRIDDWADRRAALFLDAVAQAPWTVPSHVSLFTGLEAFRHGVNHSEVLPPELETLPEILADAGYRTVAITGGGFLHPEFGFHHGFDRFHYWQGRRKGEDELPRGIEASLEALSDHRDLPLFLFFHTYEPHEPYRARQPWFERFSQYPEHLEVRLRQEPIGPENGFDVEKTLALVDRRRGVAGPLPHSMRELPRDLYASSVARVDEQVGRLLDGLEEIHGPGTGALVFTSDHGELLGEHGVAGHAYSWEENLRIPLIVSTPGGVGAGRRIASTVRSVDIAATLLDLAGIEPERRLDGRSLLPLLDPEHTSRSPRPAWTYSAKPNSFLALRLKGMKYVLRHRAWGSPVDRETVHDLRRDSGEQDPLPETGETLRLRSGALRVLQDHPPSARVRFVNRGSHLLTGALTAAALGAHSVMWAGVPPCACLRWEGEGQARFRVPPGTDATLYFEGPSGGDLSLVLDRWEGSRAARSRTLEWAPSPKERVVSLREGRWIEGGEAEPRVGVVLSWKGADRPSIVPDPGRDLAERLRALGYAD